MFTILGTLLAGLFGKPATLPYSAKREQKRAIQRGHIAIDIEQCIFCGICQRKCPTHAISVDRGEKTWAIERFCCIQCNSCVENCPKKCLVMNTEPTPVSTVMTKDVSALARVPDHPADHPNG